MPERQAELMDYLRVIGKRKWLILIPTLLCAAGALLWGLLSDPVWQVDCLIQTSYLMVQAESGTLQEFVISKPEDIAGQINQASFNKLIAADLNLSLKRFPNLKAEEIKDTKLVHVVLETEDVTLGKSILTSLYDHLRERLDAKIEFELKTIDGQIEAKNIEIQKNELDIKENENQIALEKLQIRDQEHEITTRENEIKKRQNILRSRDLDVQSKAIEKDRINKEIASNQNKLKISDDRMKSILEEMKSVKTRIDGLDEQLQKALSEKKQGMDAIGLLLYSNEVQQNLRYYNTLDEKLSTERITQENTLQDIRNKEDQLRQIDTQIKQIETQKDTIQAEIDDIQTSIKVVKTEIDKIYNQIETVKNTIDKVKNSNAALNNEISLIRDKKARLDRSQLIKSPTPSLRPVAPNLRLSLFLAVLLGLTVFTTLAFFLEYLEEHGNK
jgi:DNA repair exonuclease SbcCD ATPase subunit